MSNPDQEIKQPHDDAADDLVLVARNVFEHGAREFPLNDGTVVKVKEATMGTLPVVVNMFRTLTANIDPAALATLVDALSKRQINAILAGDDPKSVELPADDMVRKAFGHLDVGFTLAMSVMDQLPVIAETFTNLDEKKFKSLAIDEGLLIISSVFVLNYDFFSKRVLPLLAQAFKGVLAKNQNAVKQRLNGAKNS